MKGRFPVPDERQRWNTSCWSVCLELRNEGWSLMEGSECCSGEPGVLRGDWQCVLAVGVGVVGEQCSAAAPRAGTTVGNDFKATTMEIKGMRM